MSFTPNRRTVVAALAALGLSAPGRSFGQSPADGPTEEELTMARLGFGDPEPFSFDALVARAEALAAQPYVQAQPRAPEVLERLDYVEHMQIGYNPEDELPVGLNAHVQPFHLGKFFQLPVSLNLVEDGAARQFLYSESYFEVPEDNPARALPGDIGYAGFRVINPNTRVDWLAFLGAAYFRSGGELKQYGQSARALAIDVAMPVAEEFPRFTDFWFEAKRENGLVIYALLDGPRVAGALRIDARDDGPVVMDIAARYFPRQPIERFGIAALTSMFWYSETNFREGTDWRPEIHDTDGLAIWSGTGERLWRPINNPPRVMTSTFADPGVRGFGLLQRDRNFENYQDSYANYERRPSVWVEPTGDWGAGSVQLVEIPTNDEIHDNIVAYWLPAAPVAPGTPVAVSYRLHWVGDEPFPEDGARVVSTRLGKGGNAGDPPPKGVTKVVIDFQGGLLSHLDETYVMNSEETVIRPNISLSSGRAIEPHAFAVAGTGRWRAIFDYAPVALQPVEMRVYLERNGEALSETWSFQFHPTELPDPVPQQTTANP